MLQGQPRAARTSIERGLALIESLDATLAETLVPDARVTLLGLLGIQLLHLGLHRAGARAPAVGVCPCLRTSDSRWTGPSQSRLNALFEVRLGDAQRVAALADEMQALVDEFSLAHGRAACRWFRGWADARMGQPLEGYRRIRDASDQNIQLGMLAGGSETLGYAAEALLLAGDS